MAVDAASFGKWTVVGKGLDCTKPKTPKAFCRCVCGTERWVQLANLRSGASSSCGCVAREAAKERAALPKPTKPDITHARLLDLVDYDPATGLFSSKVELKKGRWPIGRILGGVQPSGYVKVCVDSRSYFAHRLAWFYMRAEWPPMIDHIDGDKQNNSFANLRVCDHAQNGWNMNGRARDLPKGIRRFRNGRFEARTTVRGVRIHIGYFDTLGEAQAAHSVKVAELHGEFARTT